MNRKSFSIPVGWPSPTHTAHVTAAPLCTIFLNSNTLVIPLRTERVINWRYRSLSRPENVNVDAPFEVERVPGSWSKHIPEKKARYRISTGHHWSIELEPTRLNQVSSNSEILVPLIARRPQTCFLHKGKTHGIYFNRDGCVPHTFCGLSEHVYASDWNLVRERFVDDEIPTCSTCLEYRSVWCVFSVFPYEGKSEAIKRVTKEKTIEARRLQLPTAYARVLDDDFLENPTYKPAHKRAADLALAKLDGEGEVDAEDEYDDPRESKRATSLDRVRRLEEAKAQVQGHRRR
jgi:hypothetical protein